MFRARGFQSPATACVRAHAHCRWQQGTPAVQLKEQVQQLRLNLRACMQGLKIVRVIVAPDKSETPKAPFAVVQGKSVLMLPWSTPFVQRVLITRVGGLPIRSGSCAIEAAIPIWSWSSHDTLFGVADFGEVVKGEAPSIWRPRCQACHALGQSAEHGCLLVHSPASSISCTGALASAMPWPPATRVKSITAKSNLFLCK